MNRLVLHSFRRCPFAIRVRMVLEEKGLEYQLIEEDLGKPSTELLKIQPSGKVPVLIHDGVVIPESAVITEYLEEIFPSPALRPDTPAGRAKVRLWTVWCSDVLKPDLDAFKYEWDSLSADAQAQLLSRLRAALTHLEVQFGAKPFLLGNSLTLADIHLFPFFRQLTRAKPNAPSLLPFPNPLIDWLERITSRPSFVRAMAR